MNVKETAALIAAQFIESDFSLTNTLLNQTSVSHVLELMNEIHSSIPAAIELRKIEVKAMAEALAVDRSYSDEETADFVRVKLSALPQAATVRSRVNSCQRTAFSRWRNGKAAALPVWWDETLTLSLVDDIYQWTPFIPRNQETINKKRKETADAKAAEIQKAADAKAAAMLEDSEIVEKAADAKAAAQIDAAIDCADRHKAAAIKANGERADIAKKYAQLETDYKALKQRAAELQAAVDRLTSVNRVLTAAVSDERVIQQAAEMLAGKAASGMV